MYKGLIDKRKKLAVIGLGYVGLPIALEFAKRFP
jgi:UDP-N-acetyl-D-galactosamine dehydrogenase